ncbi:MAG: hypothetical protein ACI36V_07885, partial [Coriobacteriales bacterium]
MKLPASAPPARKCLATACSTAVAVALLVCAATFSTIEHPSPWTQLAHAEEAAETPSPGLSISPTFQHPQAPTVSLAMELDELSFLLTDDERAHISSGGSVQIQLTSTPMFDPRQIASPPSGATQAEVSHSSGTVTVLSGESSGSGAGIATMAVEANIAGGSSSYSSQPIGQAQLPNSEGNGSDNQSTSKPSPPPIPDPLLIDSETLDPITAAAEEAQHFSSSSVDSGYTPFDIALSITMSGSPATTRQVTGPFPPGKAVKLNITLTDAIVSGIDGTGESFDFFVWHGVFDESGGLEAMSTRGTQDSRTVSIEVSSFSPFVLGWGDMKATTSTGGGTTPGSGGGGTVSGSGSGSGSGGSPSTPTPSPVPAPAPTTPAEPMPPAADDPAPE